MDGLNEASRQMCSFRLLGRISQILLNKAISINPTYAAAATGTAFTGNRCSPAPLLIDVHIRSSSFEKNERLPGFGPSLRLLSLALLLLCRTVLRGQVHLYPSSRIRPRLPSSPMAPKKQSRAKSSADLLPDPDEGDCTDQMWKKIKAVIQKLSENGEYLLPDEDAAGVPGLASLPLGWTGADVPSSETCPGGNQRCSCTRCAKLRLTLNLSSWYHAKASAGSWDACRPLPRQCRAGRSHPFRAGRPAGQRLLVR